MGEWADKNKKSAYSVFKGVLHFPSEDLEILLFPQSMVR